MSGQTTQAAEPTAEDTKIVDLDFHLEILHDKLYPYIENDTIREKLENDGEPNHRRTANHITYATPDSSSIVGPKGRLIPQHSDHIEEVMGKMHLDTVHVTVSAGIEAADGHYPRVSNALAKAYNDYVLDEVIDVDEGIYSSVLLTPWDIEFAIEELERVGDHPGFIAGQNFITTNRLWGDIEYDPIFEKLTELDLPLALHVETSNMEPNLERPSMRTTTAMQQSGQLYAVAANANNLIFSGVFDKFPDLNVIFMEVGTLWIPYVAWGSDDFYQMYPEDIKLAERFMDNNQEYLERLPSEYLIDNIYVSTQPIELTTVNPRSHIKDLLKVCHADEMFMFSSDYPHHSLDSAEWLFDYPVPEETREQIAHGNAEEVLRFPN